jgi:uncharacterized repeat protein (TIGR01451 family)
MIHHLADRAKKSLSQTARKHRPLRRPAQRATRIGALIFFAALAFTALSVPSFHSFARRALTDSATALPPAAKTAASAVANQNGFNVAASSGERKLSPALPWRAVEPLPFAPFQAAGGPAISFYKSDCSTPQSTFSPGDTVCAKIDGLDTSLFKTHFDWADPDGFILARSAEITASGQTRLFTVPVSAPVGEWQANITDQVGARRALGSFTVSDADNPAVDLSLNVDGPAKVTAGNSITYTLVLFNNGPDAAENVRLTDVFPTDTTFVGLVQNSGPIFTCANDTGATTCTIPLMPANEVAIFAITYDVASTATNPITNTASAVSDTNDLNNNSNIRERNPDDNSDSAETPISAAPCVVSCPSNINVQADAGQAGAVVSYETPSSAGDCGAPPVGETSAVSCSQASGTFFPVGTTLVTCAGQSGDACSFTVTVENPGGLKISLLGANPFTLECGTDFDDPGATAINASGQSVPVTVEGTVHQGAAGSYDIIYTATEGINSTSTTRTVIVTDTTKPIITLDGANPYRIQQGSCLSFVDPGASATDGCSGIVAVTRTTSGPNGLTSVDTNTPGTYTITYSASDGSHTETATRQVLVGNFPPDEVDQPTTSGPPTITLNGGDQITIECGSNFADPGAVATVCNGSVPVTASGAVDTHTPGTYTITYTATSGTESSETHRTVTVEDTLAPVITLNGANPLQVECHTSFTEPGAIATDACSGNVPVVISGSVDPNTPGTYTITYSATDGSHPPAQVTRTVNVVDTQGPVITLNGASSVTVECHTSYTDAGATAFDACLAASRPVTTSGSVNVNVTGTYTITYTATDGAHATTATRSVNVVDSTPPVITLKTTPITLWPPNHKYKVINVTDLVQSVNDSCGGNLSVASVLIATVTSDEAENDDGDGNTTNDILIAGDCKSVQLRAERSGNGDGRVYSITLRVRDAAGNAGTAVFKVTVPKSQGNGGGAIDSGPHYTVAGLCP